jgi:hypothetical protein
MTNRTASLLMLFVAALIATGVLLGLVVTALDGTRWSGVWVAPLIAAVCQTIALYLGRRFILPPAVAQSRLHAAWSIVTIVAGALAAALLSVWAMRWVGARTFTMPSVTLVLWFIFLWLAVRRQHWHARVRDAVQP